MTCEAYKVYERGRHSDPHYSIGTSTHVYEYVSAHRAKFQQAIELAMNGFFRTEQLYKILILLAS